jgi:rod shape-determining protein MreD
MIILFYIVLSLLCLVLQSSPLIQWFTLLNWIKPDFALLCVLYITLREEEPAVGESFAFWIGLVIDVLSGGLTGLNAFGLTVLAFGINAVKKGLSLARFWERFVFVLVCGLSFEAATLLFQKVLAGKTEYFKSFFVLALPSSIYNGILALLFFFLLDKARDALLRLRLRQRK